jgi:hypothetical protein
MAARRALTDNPTRSTAIRDAAPPQLATEAHLTRPFERRAERLEGLFEERLTGALGKETWEQEQAAGAGLTLEKAIQLARSLAETTPKTPRTSGAASPQAIRGG